MPRPVRSALLALPLLLAADAATTALAPGLSLTADAAAADFTGRVKRIRIKKTRAGSSFKVVTRTTGDSDEAVGSVETTLTPLDGGPELGSGSAEAPRSARAVWTMPATLEGEGPFTYTLTTNIDGVDETFVLEGLTLDGPWVEDSSDDGSVSFRMRLASSNHNGAQALAGALDRDHDGSILRVGGDLSGGTLAGGTLGTATLDRVTERYVSTVSAGDGSDPTGFRYAATTTVRNEDGDVVDTMQEQVTLDDSVEDDGLQSVKLRQTRRGAAKVSTVTNSLDGDVGALEVQLVDPATGAYVLDAYDTEPVSVERWYQLRGLEFEDSPVGWTYLVLFDFIGADGSVVGDQQEIELSFDGMRDDRPAAPNGDHWPDETVATFTLEGGLGIGTVEQESDGTYTMFFSTSAADAPLIEGVGLSFEEPFEGPVPLETNPDLPLVLEWKKWVQKGAEALPEAGVDVSIAVVSDEGVVLDQVQTSTSGTGSVYKAAGAGAGGTTGPDGTKKYGDILIDGVPLEFD